MRILLLSILLFQVFNSFAHESGKKGGDIEFRENKGQWPTAVLFRAEIQGGSLFLEEQGFTYALFDPRRLTQIHDLEHTAGPSVSNKEKVQLHALKVNFLGSSAVRVQGNEEWQGYSNYLLGKDSTAWASFVKGFHHVVYSDLYPGINLEVYEESGSPKYDFIVSAGADPSAVRMVYEGANSLSLAANGDMLVETSVGIFSELRPVAYQWNQGVKQDIPCRFRLNGNTVSFSIGLYDKQLPLVIDPVVVASTYSGSAATTYGHSAAYDDAGNILTGGRCFGAGYPTTPGAYDVTFGGTVDIAITKLNPTGTARIYSTYIGGSSDEYVHSMYSLPNADLLLYGSCASTNYPTTPGCFDATHNGLYDIIVTRLNSTGSGLVGSTYIGGAGDDGSNAIAYNYGDTYRGEIIADPVTGTVYIASFTSSNNFPATAGALDVTHNGAQDGVIIRLNAAFNALDWATYVGGSANDAALGLKLDASGFGLYIAGATASTNFPTQAGALHPTFLGGGMDGWVMYLASTGNFTLASSYIGTSGYDQAYFLQLDASNSVYLYGITEGNIPITPGCYGVASGNIFIMKFPFNFGSVTYRTALGSANGSNFSPTAFLVDNCGKIYISGFGSVAGYATTPNAIPSSGSFYEAVMNDDATALIFATYYGASGDHVDGGTSRFDSRGVIYQGVCTGSNTFPTLPGSVATTKHSSAGWDIAVFKIDMQLVNVTAGAAAGPSTTGCAPFTVNFTNSSTSGTTGMVYAWNYDDGTLPDSTRNATHTFTMPGTYDVMMVVYDSLTCNQRDTILLTITVVSGPTDPFPQDTTLCPGAQLTLDALNPGATYAWNTGATTQTVNVTAAGLYFVDINYAGCSRRDSIQVNTLSGITLGPDITVCDTATVVLSPGVTGATYLWSNGATTSSISPTLSGSYWVQVSSSGCQLRDTMNLTVNAIPLVQLGPDTVLCPGANISLTAANPGASYLWSTGATTQTINIVNPGTYWVQAANGLCSATDTITVNSLSAITLGPDITVCDTATVVLSPGVTGATYLWSNGATTSSISPTQSGSYWVQVSSSGCQLRDTMNLTVNAIPLVQLGSDTVLCPGANISLNVANPGASYLWNTGATTQNITITTPGTYWVQAANGLCSGTDTVTVTSLSAITLGPDLTVCDTATVVLSPGITGATYLWSNGATTPSISPTQSGSYWVQVSSSGCQLRDTMNLTVNLLPLVNLGADTLICPGNSVTLDAGNPGAAYAWNTGATNSTIAVIAAGTYSVLVANGLCVATDSVLVSVEPALSSSNDTTLCSGQSFTILASGTGALTWSDGSQGSTLTVSGTGTYWVETNNNGCLQRDTTIVTFAPVPLVNLGTDDVLCPGETRILDATNTGAVYAWNTGSTAPQIVVSTAGQYTVQASIGNCASSDTIVIDVELPLDLGPDTVLCDGDAFTLASPVQGLSYQWSTGAVSSTISPVVTGSYILTVTTQHCVLSDDILITFQARPVVDLGPDTLLCEGETILLDAGNAGAIYAWSDGSNGQQLLVDRSGLYAVIVRTGVCSETDTVKVTVADFENLNNRISLCNAFEAVLKAQENGSVFLWSTGATTSSISVRDTGVYWVETELGRCAVRDTFVVEGAPGFSQVFLPEAFTPNGDGKNDVFFGMGERLEKYSLRIFNRWGQLVFETTDEQQGWDGRFEGMNAPEGVYAYKISYQTPCSKNRPVERMGSTVLIR